MKMSELSTSSGRMVWLTNICMVISACLGFLPAVLVAKIAAILVVAYTLYRAVAPGLEAIAKMTPTPKDDAALAELRTMVEFLIAKFGTPKDAAAAQGTDNVPPAPAAGASVEVK